MHLGTSVPQNESSRAICSLKQPCCVNVPGHSGGTGAAGWWFGLLELEGVCYRSSAVLWIRSRSSIYVLQSDMCMFKPARLLLSTEMANVFASNGMLTSLFLFFFSFF